jgi:hypothetical protein
MLRTELPGVVLMLLVFAGTWATASEFRVPLMKQPPKIDGKIEPGEWAASAGFDGFLNLGDKKLERRRARGFVGATETHLYCAIQTQLPDEGELNTSITTDTLKAVHDDSLEVYVCPTPDAVDKVDYQFLTNSLGKGGYNIHILGKAKEDASWNGGYQQAHGFHDGWWHAEIAIPLEKLGAAAQGRKATDGVWSVNLTRNWKPDWGWSALGTAYPHAGFHFVFTADPAPGVRYEWSADPSFPPAEGRLIVTNPGDQPLDVKAFIDVVRNNMPEIKEEKALSLKAGASDAVSIKLDASDPTQHFEMTVKVTSADGKTVYYERQTKWSRAKAANHWATSKPKDAPPADFRFAYYPYKNKLRISADINGLPKEAKPSRVAADVRAKAGSKVIKTIEFPLDAFKSGRQELTVELPMLEGEYEIALKVEGENVPKGELAKPFERTKFPWENCQAGRSTKIFAPFTPIKVDGKKLSTVLREHTLNDVGLLDQVTGTSANTGVARPMLAAPMRYVVKCAGQEAKVEATPLKVASAKEHAVRTESAFSAGPLKASVRNLWDYDGTVRVDVTLEPTGDQKVDAFTLEIPFLADAATMIHANSDRIRAPVAQKIPAGEGVVWDARKVACDDYPKNFCPYVYIGTPARGLCWFAENDKGWSWDAKTPNIEVVRQNGQVILRVHLINQPTAIGKPQTLSFGLLAAPVKPMWSDPKEQANWWRYRYERDRYTLLGTDINWLALGCCGSVYPTGCDMYFWEMLAKGNKEHLNDDQIKPVYERGLKYWEPYGKDEVNTWKAHVWHNLRSRYGMRMVYYYNRATCQLFPETQTFMDEWLLEDFRSMGKGDGRGEIKIVPSESYIDYNLYWYEKSFEIGGNQGVYWDNWFICPSFNTEMTDAYVRPDGSIFPAAGIWGQRELAKRTFVMMNEHGMRPIVFPHMTSFSPLPMLSFATVQYEWEWKYSSGDVQDRFEREYIQLVSTGELAGVWPVPLGDQGGQANDLRIQRTFLAARLVHELDGYGGTSGTKEIDAQFQKLTKPIYALTDKAETKVYKYWDERPQPVKSADANIPAIVYSLPEQETVAVVVSYSDKDADVTLDVDLKALGLDGGCKVSDVETGGELLLKDGKLVFPLKKHDMKELRFAK